MRVKKTVVIADEIHPEGIKILSGHFKIVKKYGLTNEELLNFISRKKDIRDNGYILIIRSVRKFGGIIIRKFKQSTRLTAICTVSSGFDNVDIDSAKKSGIRVINVPYGNYISAAEHTFALILTITKKIVEKNNEVKSGKFFTQPGQTTELMNKTIGIIGVGKVGSNVARFAKAFRMNILGNDIKKSLIKKYKWIRFVSLEYLLKNSDYITIHTPLDETTRYLINKNNINLMGMGSIIINCARGGVIEEKTLFRALKDKKIFYAGLDVFENEPDINFAVSHLDNALLTPHIAGKTKESYKRMAVQAAETLIKNF